MGDQVNESTARPLTPKGEPHTQKFSILRADPSGIVAAIADARASDGKNGLELSTAPPLTPKGEPHAQKFSLLRADPSGIVAATADARACDG
jgi:hypothetical protein